MNRRPRLTAWNCNGLPGKRQELLQFLQEFNVDVALLQETHLLPAMPFTAPNYAVYRTDRPRPPGHVAHAAGGTAILVHRRIPHRPIPRPGWDTEVTSVAVSFGGQEIELSSVYNPPSKKLRLAELDLLLAPGRPALVAGDFNSKCPDWGCHSTNASGRHLLAYLDTRRHITVSAPTQPTHYPANPHHRPDILDFALHCHLPAAVVADATNDLSSDHLPITIILDQPATYNLPPGRRPRVNWAKYYNYLADRPHPITPPLNPDDLDAQVIALQACLGEAVDSSTLPAPPTPDHRRRLPPDLQAEVRQRRLLRRTWQRTRCPRDKARFNAQSQRVKRLLQDHSEGRWKDYLDTLRPEDGSVWKLAKALRADKRVERPLQGRGGLVYNPREKAEVFADCMEVQFSPHEDVRDDQHTELVEAALDAAYPEDEEEDLPQIQEAEVAAALARLRPRKAPGPDRLGPPALRRLPAWVITWITTLFNSSLTLRHFPKSWKLAKLILLPKPSKNLTLPENHRPISLLPALSKVLERLILARFPDEFHLSIRQEQYGFRRGHSTTLQLSKVVTTLVDNTNKGHLTAAVTIDVSKAFDRVWHEGLLYKLLHSPLPSQLFQLLRSYLSDRQFEVSVGQATSTRRPIKAGVPQGSVLGPVLYLWYTNDIPLAPRVSLALYADDALFHVSSTQIRQACTYLQRQMNLLESWLLKWKIKVNTTKSEATCFTRKRWTQVLRHRINLQGDELHWTKKIRYLGIDLTRTLQTTTAATRRLNLGKAAQQALLPILQPKSPLSIATKLLIYKTLIRPVTTYAAPAWYPLTPATTRKKLEAFQCKTVRRLMDLPWFVRNTVVRSSAGLPTIEDFVKEQTRKLYATADASEWDHIRAWASSEGPLPRKLKRPRTFIADDPP